MRGEWLILPEEALARKALVMNLLNGGNINLTEFKTPALKTQIAFDDLPINAMEDCEDAPSRSMFDRYPPGSIAIISYSGVMTKYDTCESNGTETVSRVLQSAYNASSIIGVIMVMDSGGGAINSIAPLRDTIIKRNKPVLALCDVAASAAYWAICPCDHIMASNTLSSAFGSIGLYTGWLNLKKFYEMQGVEEIEIYAPQSTHKNLPVRKADEGDTSLMENEVLSPIAADFQSDVKKYRTNLVLETEGILAGAMFRAKIAVKNGLVDSIGSMADAVKMVQKISTIKQFINS